MAARVRKTLESERDLGDEKKVWGWEAHHNALDGCLICERQPSCVTSNGTKHINRHEARVFLVNHHRSTSFFSHSRSNDEWEASITSRDSASSFHHWRSLPRKPRDLDKLVPVKACGMPRLRKLPRARCIFNPTRCVCVAEETLRFITRYNSVQSRLAARREGLARASRSRGLVAHRTSRENQIKQVANPFFGNRISRRK